MLEGSKATILDPALPLSQRIAAAEGAAVSAHADLVQLLLQIAADESESIEALREFGDLLARVTSTLALTEWDLHDGRTENHEGLRKINSATSSF